MKNRQGDITLFLQTQAKQSIALVVYKSITKHRKSLSTGIACTTSFHLYLIDF